MSEGKRRCDCGSVEAFSDDLIDFQLKGGAILYGVIGA